MTATRTLKTLSDLDLMLDRLADDPEGFAAKAKRRAQDWNRKEYDLELRDPSSWKNAASSARPDRDNRVASIEEQLRTEIDMITIMDREEEARHARRIEFARLRLEHSLNRHRLTEEEIAGKALYSPTTYRNVCEQNCELPAEVCRRWVELHHLRTELVERNLYLAVINVERYAHLGIARLDLIQEGSAALFRAVDGFDWRRGLLFRTYAVHWLNQAYRSYLYNNGQTVRVPVYLQKAMKHVRRAQNKLGPDASIAAIAEEADLGEHLVESALAASRSTMSIDSPFGTGDSTNNLAEVLGAADESGVYSVTMEDSTLEDGIHGAMDRLSERERFVIEMRFGINREREHTLSEVAKELGVSLERVRQIQVRAINKMKTPGLRKAIDPFL
ncbi:RNA polymerase sigma factor SigA [Planctomycetes bacterium Poly30]|uniref:RNA polymerase sigma factor SigA n=1 Tax=Saltatorellus ferox TaxID=2528018 RepID=A0A518EPQ1_9BACT|nr:RNA polymerase sigma factor SigA [Planctomycetes bacterium Poly30]